MAPRLLMRATMRMSAVALPLVLTFVLAVTRTAAAAPPSPTDAYNGEVLLADLASWAFVALPNDTARGLGGVGLFLAAPVIHLAHQHPARAAVSLLGLRVALPLLAGVVVGTIVPPPTDCPHGSAELCPARYVFEGILGGFIAGQVIDWAFLSGPAPLDAPSRAPRLPRTVAGPTLQLRAGSVTLGYAGTF